MIYKVFQNNGFIHRGYSTDLQANLENPSSEGYDWVRDEAGLGSGIRIRNN